MSKKILFAALFTLTVSTCGLAQGVYTPEKNSLERKAILDAIRLPVEAKLKQKIQFSIETFNVSGNWAYLSGTPLDLSGNKPNFRGTVYQDAIDAGAFDNNLFALLKKTPAGKWKTVTYRIGCTDVCFATWWKDYRAPKALFPMNY